jgi:predicted enzyme related to lactoylglutathione lyase
MNSVQLMYVLLDRAVIFYSSVINWAHGRRDYTVSEQKQAEPVIGIPPWDKETKKICNAFYARVVSRGGNKKSQAKIDLVDAIAQRLKKVP